MRINRYDELHRKESILSSKIDDMIFFNIRCNVREYFICVIPLADNFYLYTKRYYGNK